MLAQIVVRRNSCYSTGTVCLNAGCCWRYSKRVTTASASSLGEDILAGSCLFTLTSRQGANCSILSRRYV
ncbi:hypothetical protein E2C01_044847 [Portunus trituberculatus]|uniref:Uncharacterized protein n=1 Tax=Portunus trituberculatus TaxID=210409 RepID=A0A5B7FT62_PORTR|nr:hypothetical protein [Portunus trituberculatus]